MDPIIVTRKNLDIIKESDRKTCYIFVLSGYGYYIRERRKGMNAMGACLQSGDIAQQLLLKLQVKFSNDRLHPPAIYTSIMPRHFFKKRVIVNKGVMGRTSYKYNDPYILKIEQ